MIAFFKETIWYEVKPLEWPEEVVAEMKSGKIDTANDLLDRLEELKIPYRGKYVIDTGEAMWPVDNDWAATAELRGEDEEDVWGNGYRKLEAEIKSDLVRIYIPADDDLPLGLEVVSWSKDEWMEDPETVIPAIANALNLRLINPEKLLNSLGHSKNLLKK